MAAFSNRPSSPADLATKLKAALDARQTNAFFELYYWANVDKEIQANTREFSSTVFSEGTNSVSAVSNLGNFKQQFEGNGITYTFNLPINGHVEIVTSVGKMRMPFGVTNGSYHIAVPIQDPNQKASTNLQFFNVMVFGPNGEKENTFEGHVITITLGKEKRVDISGQSSFSEGFWADDIKHAEVKQKVTEGETRMRLFKGKDKFFDMEATNSTVPIVYDK